MRTIMSKNIINFVIGDWSYDGHGRTRDIKISSNLSDGQIEKAYKKAVKKIGFNLINECCYDSDSRSIEFQYIKKLHKSGFDIKKLFEHNDSNNDEIMDAIISNKKCELRCEINCDIYFEIYMHFIKIGDDNFQYEIIEGRSINIGGYGLFWC